MDDLHSASRSTNQPDGVPSDVPEQEQRERDLPEGQIPRLPVSNDPLGQPQPHPQERERPPLD
jgi:hypothetical protein